MVLPHHPSPTIAARIIGDTPTRDESMKTLGLRPGTRRRAARAPSARCWFLEPATPSCKRHGGGSFLPVPSRNPTTRRDAPQGCVSDLNERDRRLLPAIRLAACDGRSRQSRFSFL